MYELKCRCGGNNIKFKRGLKWCDRFEYTEELRIECVCGIRTIGIPVNNNEKLVKEQLLTIWRRINDPSNKDII